MPSSNQKPYPFHKKPRVNWVRVALGVLTPIVTMLLLAAWASKESTTDHAADMKDLRSTQQRILDVVCEDRPEVRACK